MMGGHEMGRKPKSEDWMMHNQVDEAYSSQNINLTALESNVNETFPVYMYELLRTNEGRRETEKGVAAYNARNMPTELPPDNIYAAGVPGSVVQIDGSVKLETKEKKAPSKKRGREVAGDEKEEGDGPKGKRPTSSLRKLQNKLSQQRFRQKKREIETQQQEELDKMQSKINELELAKAELPELRKQNESLEKSLNIKDRELQLLRKEIAMAKSERFEKTKDIAPVERQSPNLKKENCTVMKNRLLLATTHEYENTVNELRNIALSYPNGMPDDDDVDAQRRIATVLYNFVDLAAADSASPCIRSLLAASLAYLSMYGLDRPALQQALHRAIQNLNLSSVQEMKIMAERDKLMSDLKLIYDERKIFNQRIQEGFVTEGPIESYTDVESKLGATRAEAVKNATSNSLVDDVDELKNNLLCECQMRQNYQVSFFKLLQPIQILKLILGAEPAYPDLIAISNAISLNVEDDSKNTLSFTEPS